MRIRVATRVGQNYLKVKEGFNEALFTSLTPPFPPVKLLCFEGSTKGDRVSLELDFFFFRQVWTSVITEDKTDAGEFYFIDKGVRLPFFLKAWEHKHRIISLGEGRSEICDEIQYSGGNKLSSWLLFPVLYLQFFLRKPVYKKHFGPGK